MHEYGGKLNARTSREQNFQFGDLVLRGDCKRRTGNAPGRAHLLGAGSGAREGDRSHSLLAPRAIRSLPVGIARTRGVDSEAKEREWEKAACVTAHRQWGSCF